VDHDKTGAWRAAARASPERTRAGLGDQSRQTRIPFSELPVDAPRMDTLRTIRTAPDLREPEPTNLDRADARGRANSATGQGTHNVPAEAMGLSSRRHPENSSRYQEALAEGGASEEFMMWARTEARMR
jgi:hypothetical protein